MLHANRTAQKKQATHLAPVISGDLTVAVIGCGYWGPKLARNFNDLPGTTLAAVADLRQDRLTDMQNQYPNVATTRRYQDLLESDVDAVVLATPVNTHFPLAKEALLAGKHILIEKPITACSKQAQELEQIARERGLTLMVGHTFEYNPAVEAVREIVQSGELGEIYYLNAIRVNLGLLQPDINVMWDLAPHDISIMRYILEAEPVRVSARGATYVNPRRSLHEVVYMNVTFDGGVMANLRISWLDPVKERKMTVVGSKKMLVYDDIAEQKVVIYDKGVDVPAYSVTEEDFHASYRHGDETVYPIEWVEPLKVECEHFRESILTGRSPRSSAGVGYRVVRVLETAEKSLLNGGEELPITYTPQLESWNGL